MKLYLFCFFFCASSIAFSQNKNTLTNTEYIVMRDKIKALTNSNIDSAFVYIGKLERSDNYTHKAFALGAKSYLLQYKGDSIESKKIGELAFVYLKKVSNGFEKTKLNSYLLNYKGLAEWKRGNLKKALQAYIQGRSLSQSIGDVIQHIKFNNNISSIYSDVKNYRLAIKIARESDRLTDLNVHQYEKEKYKQSKTTVSYKLGSFYENEFFTKEKDNFLLDSALYYYKKTLVYSDYTATNNATAQLNIGNIYAYKGDLRQAEKMYLGLLKHDKYDLTDDNFKYLNLNLGILYYKQQKYKEALIYFQRVDSTHLVNNNSPAAFYYSNYYQAKIYDFLKNHDESLKHSRIFLEYYDKTESKLLDEIIDINFAVGKQAAAKEILEMERSGKRIVFVKRALLGILIIVVIFFIVFLLLKNNKKRKDNQKAMLLIEEFKRQIEGAKSHPEVKLVPKREIITIDEEKENEIVKKLLELEDKMVFLNQDYTQQFVAKKIKTNTTYLSYVVNKRFGKSFSEYANELKINYVINELITNPTYRKYSTQAIAESAGYKKANSFTLSFKKRTGLTPVQFAEKIESDYNI